MLLALVPGAAIAMAGCGCADASRLGNTADAAARVYVAPGKYDEFYAFFSEGSTGRSGSTGCRPAGS